MGHLTANPLPKINNCKECRGQGYIQYWNLDGGPYYSWMKPEKRICDCCKAKKEEIK